MAFKPTEFTIRDILLAELRARGVKTGFEISFAVPEGQKPPDALLANGATYVLLTKLGGEADDEEDVPGYG